MLAERLALLGLHLRDVAPAALLTTPTAPATDLIQGCEAVEQRLSTVEHQMVVELGGRISASN